MLETTTEMLLKVVAGLAALKDITPKTVGFYKNYKNVLASFNLNHNWHNKIKENMKEKGFKPKTAIFFTIFHDFLEDDERYVQTFLVAKQVP